MAASHAAVGTSAQHPTIPDHGAASVPGGEDSESGSPVCGLCGTRVATTTGPVTVNGQVVFTDPLCEACHPDRGSVARFLRRAAGRVDPQVLVDAFELSAYQVSNLLGVRAAVETYCRRHDL